VFSKDMLIGIILSCSKFDLHLSRCDKSKIGYRVRLRLNIRGNKDFLLAIERTLLQYEIESTFKEEEHKTRPRPILKIGGILNLYKLSEIIPDTLPDLRGEWSEVRKAIDIVANKQHLTLEGMEQLFELKGVI
jgi:hypothetical protein|tara:strand:+ start:647 stop:1045 length:399 start_codon:yes stop_codon:yes gene_type:complete